MDFCAVAGDDDNDDDLHTHDSDYHRPELRYGAWQAFAVLKARKMGLDVCYRKIVSPRNTLQLHTAIRQMECHIQGHGHNKDHVLYNKGKVVLYATL